MIQRTVYKLGNTRIHHVTVEVKFNPLVIVGLSALH